MANRVGNKMEELSRDPIWYLMPAVTMAGHTRIEYITQNMNQLYGLAALPIKHIVCSTLVECT